MATNVIETRVFDCTRDDGAVVKIRVRLATRRELEAADLEQSRIFNQALLSGLPPRMRMVRKLREQGLWTREDEESLNDLRSKVQQANARLTRLDGEIEALGNVGSSTDATAERAAKLNAEKAEAVTARQDALQALNRLRSEIDSMLGHTADAKADDAHRNFLLACVAEYVTVSGDKTNATGRVWASVDGLLAEQDTGLLQRTVYEYMTFNAGMASEWETNQAASAGEATAAKPAGESAATAA